MKKYILLFSFILLFTVTGCADMMNTPSKRVEEFLGKYQTMDRDVLTDLDQVVDKNSEYSNDGKKEYKSLMQKQYQNLSYKIKNEETDGDTATVEVELEVFDYHNALEDAKEYIKNHKEEFLDDKDKKRSEKVEEYKIKSLKSTTDKANYTIDFHLTKKDKKWILEPISDRDLEKIHGLYASA